ncbi:MAG: putative Holliday junction resolvase-like endonuclease [Myxococcota bacterium]|jgi:predicted Holliday junction resolvase-like endonuclease
MRRAASIVLLLSLSPQALAQGLSFEEIVIEGEVQKPEVTIVISRENLNKSYELKLEESFLKRIVDALRLPPF